MVNLFELQKLSYISQGKKYFILRTLQTSHSLEHKSLKTGVEQEVEHNKAEIEIETENFNKRVIVDKK
jgi:hypothetical protein